MKGAIVHSTRSRAIFPLLSQILLNYFFQPLKNGLYGFAAFFTVLITIKAVIILFGDSDYFLVSTGDVLLSLLGLGIVFMVQLVHNFKSLIRKSKRSS